MSDFSASKSYILNINQIDESQIDLAGERAVNISQLARLGAPVLSGFIITSKTFDDFLFANNLIPQIAEINREFSKGQIDGKKAEQMIGRVILSGKFPNLIENMLSRAYGLLTNGNKSSLSLISSSVNADLKKSALQTKRGEVLVDSYENFQKGIKFCWTELFAKEALEARKQTKYKGILTQAIMVSRYLQPEVSGEIYTLAVDNADPVVTELRAVYGHNHPILPKKYQDRYLFEKTSESIIDKTISRQAVMLVAKNSKFEKIKVTKSKQESFKLNDTQILKLAKTATKLKEYFKNELKISWQFHGGKFLFTEMARLTERDLLDARELLTKTGTKIKTNNESVEEGFKLQPINKLTVIAGGNGNKKGLAYGRVKFVSNKDDLEKAKGVDIILCPKIFRGLDLSQVRYRGLIVEERVKYNEIEMPSITGVEGAKNLLLENEIVTIDTNSGKIYLGAGYQSVDESVEKSSTQQVKTASNNIGEINLTIPKVSTSGIFRRTGQKGVQEQPNWLPNMVTDLQPEVYTESGYEQSSEKNLDIPQNARNIEEEWFLKKPVFKDFGMNDTQSAISYWQLFNTENPVVVSDTEGLYLKISEILKKLDLDKYELNRNKPLKLKFLRMLADYLERFEKVKQISLLLDINQTAKATLLEEEILDLQLEIVKHLRNKAEIKNLSIVLPDVRTEKDLVVMKKTVTSIGLRRTASFNVMVEIASPLAAISLGKMVEDGLDGMIIDLDKFLFALYEEERHRLTPEVSEFLNGMIDKVSKTSAPLYLSANNIILNDDELREFVEAGITGFVFPERKMIELSAILQNMEIKNLRHKKRGRKPKSINYP